VVWFGVGLGLEAKGVLFASSAETDCGVKADHTIRALVHIVDSHEVMICRIPAARIGAGVVWLYTEAAGHIAHLAIRALFEANAEDLTVAGLGKDGLADEIWVRHCR